MGEQGELAGYAFISYVREDAGQVDLLQHMLEAAGVRVWRDTADLWPGEDWRMKIRRAITDGALVFIACFSDRSHTRPSSYQNEELVLAIDQLRARRPEEPWLIPVRFDDCPIPDVDIGGGRTLASLQRADVFGDRRDENAARLVAAVLRILGKPGEAARPMVAPTTGPKRHRAARRAQVGRSPSAASGSAGSDRESPEHPNTGKPRSRSLWLVTIAIIVVLIVVGGVVALSHALGSGSSPSGVGSSSSGRPSLAGGASTSGPPRTAPETVQYQVTEWSSYAGPSGIQTALRPGDVVAVACRIPGNATTPSSVGAAGWYKIRNRSGSTGYAAANSFYNDPGNGRGTTPNQRAFDPVVRIC